MALSLGTLYVQLSAKADGFHKTLDSAAKKVDDVSRSVKKLGNEMAQMGAGLAAVAAGAIAVAKDMDAGVSREFDKFKAASVSLSIEVARALLPALQELTRILQGAANWFAGLSPGVKAAISDFGLLAVQVGAAAGVIGKVSSLVGEMAGPIATVAKVLLSGPVLAFAAFAAAAWFAAGFVREAWDTNLLGIQDTFKAVWDWLVAKATSVFSWFRDSASKLGDWFGSAFQRMKALTVQWALGTINTLEKLGKLIGIDASGLAQFGRDLVMWANHVTTSAGLAELAKPLETGMAMAARGAQKNWEDALGVIKRKIAEVMGGGGVAAKGVNLAELEKRRAEQLAFFRKQDVGRGAAQFGAAAPGSLGTGTTPQMAAAIDKAIAAERSSLYGRARSAVYAVSDALKFVAEKIGSAGAMLLQATGSFGDVVAATVEGGMTGGPWGAIIALVASLLSKSSQFGQAVELLAHIVQQVADGIGSAIGPLSTVLGAISNQVGKGMETLVPLLAPIAALLEGFAPILQLVAEFMGGFAHALEAISKPLVWLVSTVLRGFYDAIRWLGVGLLKISREMGNLWNGIVSGIQSFFRWIGDFEVAGWKPFAFMHDLANGMDAWKISMEGLTQRIMEIEGLSYEAALAKAQATRDEVLGIQKATASLEKFNEQLSNVPQGYRIAKARFDSTKPADSLLSDEVWGRGARPEYVFYVQVNGTGSQAWQQMKDAARKEAAQISGNPFATVSW